MIETRRLKKVVIFLQTAVLLCAEQRIEVIENKILQMTQEETLVLKEQCREVTFLQI